MKTFTYIAHKCFIHDVNYHTDIDIDNCQSLGNVSHKSIGRMSYIEHIFKNSKNNLHIDFVKCVFVFSDEPKFKNIKNTYIDSFFFSGENRKLYIDFFCKIQKTYWAFNTLAKRIKSRHSKIKVTDDLFLTPILPSQTNVFRLYENNCSYLFTLQDLSRIIISSISNSPMFHSEPIPPKNSYSGVVISKSNLYNIYFAMKHQLAIVPNVIHQFFLCEFDIALFAKHNLLIIRDIYINQFVNNEDEDEIIESIYDMLQEYPQISIDVEFPDNILIETFKSSVTNFLHFRYNFDASKKIPNYKLMSRKMNSIIKECPGIGRKIFVFKDGRKYTSFITLNGKSEPVLYVKPITKYTTIEDDISDDDTTEEGQIANESNTSLFAFDPEFSTHLDELIHVTDVHVRTDNLYDTDDYFDSDDEIEVNEDLYDP